LVQQDICNGDESCLMAQVKAALAVEEAKRAGAAVKEAVGI
jgi:hypothetical protein